jgi:hypothetical protein
METYIIRHYPNYKSLIKNIEYPNRTNKNDVELIRILSTNKDYNDDYKKWLSGINYESKTKNKIKIGGNLHVKLGKKFILNHIVNHTKYNTYDLTYYSYNYEDILFKDVDNIDWDIYFLETEQIYDNIDNENKNINENNEKVIEYNNRVNEAIKNINLLEEFNQYVVFEGIKYGIPNVYNNVHREDNCFGLIEKYYYESCTCHCCEYWGGCSNPTGIQYYKCKKCDYKYSETINYSKNYKGK